MDKPNTGSRGGLLPFYKPTILHKLWKKKQIWHKPFWLCHLQLLATVIAMKEHMGWKISVRGKEICWSQDFIMGKTATQIRWPSSRRQKKDMQKRFSFLLQIHHGLAWMCLLEHQCFSYQLITQMAQVHRWHYHSVGYSHIHREHLTQMPKVGRSE